MILAKPRFAKLNKNHPISDRIVGAWPMIEGAATTIKDKSGKSHNATIETGTPVMAHSKYGQALEQNATSERMQVPASDDFTFADAAGDTKASMLCVFKITNIILIVKNIFFLILYLKIQSKFYSI